MAVFPNKQQMNDVERSAWRVSCNFQRSIHPLYKRRLETLKQQKRSLTSDQSSDDENGVKRRRMIAQIPKPTAVHVSILKIQST